MQQLSRKQSLISGVDKSCWTIAFPPFDLPTNHSFFWGNCTNNVCFRTFIWCLSLQVSRKFSYKLKGFIGKVFRNWRRKWLYGAQTFLWVDLSWPFLCHCCHIWHIWHSNRNKTMYVVLVQINALSRKLAIVQIKALSRIFCWRNRDGSDYRGPTYS